MAASTDEPPEWPTSVSGPGTEGWAAAATFHYQQYLALKWIEPNCEHVVLEYEPWSTGAVAFHTAHANDRSIVGTLRTIHGPIQAQPLAHACPEIDVSHLTGDCVEFSSLVVDPAVKSLRAAENLYASGFTWTVTSGARSIVALVETWLYDILVQEYGVPFSPIGGAIDYLGTTVLPISADVAEIAESCSGANPRFWSLLSADLNESQIKALLASVEAATDA